MSSAPYLPIVTRDPRQHLFEVQRARQRFGRGLVATLLFALPYTWVWSLVLAAVTPGSKPWMFAVALGAAPLGLPLRLLGRVIELRLALVAGALAVPSYALASYLANGRTSLLPPGLPTLFVACFFVVAFVATATARESLDVALTKPSARKRIGLPGVPPPAPHEDENAVVLEEPANIQRGIITVPGTLVLTPRHLKFTERNAAAPAPVLSLADLVEAGEGVLPRSFTVKVRDGSSVSFVVLDADKWIMSVNLRLE